MTKREPIAQLRKRKRLRLTAEERRDLVLKAAQEVFAHSGLRGARTKEIAARAGVVESVLFDHFESKEAMFEAAVLEPLQKAVAEQAEIARAAVNKASGHAQAESSIKAHERFLEAMIESFPLLRAALLSGPGADGEIYQGHIFPLIETLAELTRERLGAERLGSVDVEFMTLMGFGVHFMIAMDQYHRKQPLDVHKAAERISSMFAFGIVGK